jgi:beta-phosphoglucomutase-like phosphatase (HAD superfamily)
MSGVQLIAFDLDGVLIETKEFHFKALNEALSKKYEISIEEHLSIYDGLKTTRKLEILTEKKMLPRELHLKIWEDKQKRTLEYFAGIVPDENLIR